MQMIVIKNIILTRSKGQSFGQKIVLFVIYLSIQELIVVEEQENRVIRKREQLQYYTVLIN